MIVNDMAEQLIKKAGQGYNNVYPKTFTSNIFDRETGQSLENILSNFNCYFLSYNGTRGLTRLQVPDSLRKQGLWITYVLYDNTVVLEYYNGLDIDNGSWSDSGNWITASNFLVGDVSVSSEGNWIVNGTDTGVTARGEQGITPLLLVMDNKLSVSYNGGNYWEHISDYIAPKLRWVDANEGLEDNSVGKLLISMDLGSTWSDLSPEFTNNLKIKGYVTATSNLPASASLGDIYGVGPTYDESDTSHENPRYNIYVKTSSGWVDNGKMSSLPVGVVLETGDAEDKVMSQKAVSDIISQEVESINVGNLAYSYSSNIDILGGNSVSNFKGIVAACKEGDEFQIAGKGGGAYYLWAFIDKNFAPISSSGASATANSEVITAPADTAWLVVNFNTGYAYSLKDLRPMNSFVQSLGLQLLKSQIEMYKNGAVLNVNAFNALLGGAGEPEIYQSPQIARDAVPAYLREKGLSITYRLATGWETEQYNGDYPSSTTWNNDGYWTKVSRNNNRAIIAASNTSRKANATFVCSGEADELIINLALLTYDTVELLAGTYVLNNPIVLSRSNSVLIGNNTAKLEYSSNYTLSSAIITGNSSTNVVVSGIDCGSRPINLFSSGSGRIVNCIALNRRINDFVITVKAYEGTGGINSAIARFDNNGGIIFLEEGTYAGSEAVNLNKSNVIIEGKGRNTTIDRSTGYNDILCNTEGIKNCIVRGVNIAHSVQHYSGNTSLLRDFKLENCYINGRTFDQSQTQDFIVTVGENQQYETLSSALTFVTNTGLKNKGQHYEIHIYGDVKETTPLGIDLYNVDIIGHNAKVVMHGDGSVCANFYGSGYKVKGVHFYKTGCYTGYQHAAANVNTDNVVFEDCIFENASFSTKAFDQRNYVVSAEETAGCRRHGILVNCTKYGKECKTIFINCTAIGSPFSFQNTRGWYLVTGAPKLYNCIGYGGGIGEFGHGIQNHRTSQAELHQCVGYAGEHSWRQAAGIRMQASGSPNMIGCIGYGSYGTKQTFAGFANSEIEEAGGSMNLTIEQAKSKLVEVGASTEESYGISAWANNGKQNFISCEGFAGCGENSKGLHIISQANPKVVGGVFGLDDLVNVTPFRKDSGELYMTFNVTDRINVYSKFVVTGVCVTIVKYAETNVQGYKFYLETVEPTPQIIVDGEPMYGYTSILNCSAVQTHVNAGVMLKAYVKDGAGNLVSLTDDENPTKCAIWVQTIYRYDADGIVSLYIDNSASPQVNGCRFNGDINICTISNNYYVNNCIIDGTLKTNLSNLKVYDCAFSKNVDPDINFASKQSANSSSNYMIEL